MLLHEIFDVDPSEVRTYGAIIFAYLFGRIDQDQMSAEIKEINPEKLPRILAVIRAEATEKEYEGAAGYVLCHCKAYAWAFHKSRTGGPRVFAKDFEVSDEDAKLLRRLNLSHIPDTFPSYRLPTFKNMVFGIANDLAHGDYAGKYISKRMTFLLRSYGVAREEIESMLFAAATRAMYMKFPQFENKLHLTNVAKSQIHNSGETFVTYHTSPSRNVLMKTSDGKFESRHVSTENLVDLQAPQEYMNEVKESLEMLVDLAMKRNMRPDVQRFLMIAAGHYDAEFSTYLQCDNSVAVDEMAYSRYLSKARKHFNFSETQVEKLFRKLGQCLS